VSAMFIPEVDELIAHFDVRREYAFQQGEELANIFDMNVARMLLQAAREDNQVDGLPGGEQIWDTNALAGGETGAETFAAMIFEAQAALDEKDVPDGDRWVAVKPSLYYNLVESTSKAIHRDFSGAGSYADGVIIRIAGVPIVKTNNLPQENDTANTDLFEKYRDDYSATAGILWHRSAVGTVKLQDLAASMDWDPRRLGTLLTSRYLVGHGILRPESAVELRTTDPNPA
jgi:hypothetical protein